MQNTTELKWFQNGPTTHLTNDGDTSLCGSAEVSDFISPKRVDDLSVLNLCDKCEHFAATHD